MTEIERLHIDRPVIFFFKEEQQVIAFKRNRLTETFPLFEGFISISTFLRHCHS